MHTHVEGMKIFCDLVETQSFAKAGSMNAITQSAVSQQLKSLERQQNTALIERHRHVLVLTAAGEVFYAYAQTIARDYEAMQAELHALDGVVSGSVRLACIYSMGMTELGPHVRAFLQAHPRVKLMLDYDTSRQIVEKVSHGGADLGIAMTPGSPKNVEIIPFMQDPLVVICSPENPLSEVDPLPIGALDRKPFIAFEEGAHTRDLLDLLFRKNRVHPHTVMELNHVSTVKHAVEEDMGVSILSLHAVKNEIRLGTLVARTLEGIQVTRPLSILHRANRKLPMGVQALINMLNRPPSAIG